jgi:putative ABC transport system permease protein
MTPDEFSFILLGLFEVFAGVLLLTSAAPVLVSKIGRSQFFTKRWGPVLPVALAHPLSTPVRTAVVMGMFSITVFSVIVLSGYTEQFDNYSSSFVEDTEGEFELMLTASRSRPLELSSDPLEWNLSTSLEDDIDAVGKVYRSEVFLEDNSGERMPYILRGFDDGFANHGGLPLYLWDESLGATAEEAWISIGNRDDIVLVDASFGLELSTDGTGISRMSFSIGDSISLIDLSNPGNSRNVVVGGFLEQSSYLFSPGVWINSEISQEQFDSRLTRMYVSLSEQATPSSSFDSEEIQTFSAAGKSADLRIASAELAQHLEDKLNGKGVSVSVISDDVMLIQSLVLALLGIFEGYLALGLIVGIAGIGVVTVRSVSERRRTIGILRALGYRKRMVTATFLVEVSWVGLLGILNGVLVAVGFHRSLYNSFWKDQGADFALPWPSIIAVLVGGWILIIMATIVPIRSASKVPPSAALRDI